MNHWLTFSLAAVLFWGLWAFLPTVASTSLDPRSVVVFQTAGTLAVLVGMAAFGALRFRFEAKGAGLAFASGVAGTVGSIAFVFALTKGRPSTVLTVTALYPVVAFILAFLVLHEELTRKKLLSIAFAIAAVLLSVA